MAEVTSIGNDPVIAAHDEREAVSAVLDDIAGCCYSIQVLAREAIQHGGTTEAAAMLEGAEALAARAGALSDRVSYMLTRNPGKMEDQAWLHPPRTCEALKTLKARESAASRP